MNIPKFDNTWTFGNTLTLIVIVLGGVAAYTELHATMRAQGQALSQYRETVIETRSSVMNNDSRIRALELGAGRIEERLVSINAALARIEASLKERGAER